MPITPHLSRQLRQTLGEEAAEDLVNWMHEMDAHRGASRDAIRADLAELRQEMHAGLATLREEMLAGFARADARDAELREDMLGGFARADARHAELREDMLGGFARTDAKLAEAAEHRAQLEARFERRFGDLIKWSFVFWVGAVGAIAMLAGALP